MNQEFRKDIANIQKRLTASFLELNELGVRFESGIVREHIDRASTEVGSLHTDMRSVERDVAKLSDDVAKIRVRAMDGIVRIQDELADARCRFVAIQFRVHEICELVQAGEEILAWSEDSLNPPPDE